MKMHRRKISQTEKKKSGIVVNCIIRYIRTIEASKAEASCKDKKSFLRMGRYILPRNISSF